MNDAFLNYTGGIFIDASGTTSQDHAISLVGWGVENGTKYWIGRNSWGEYWGIKGFFKILRGSNNMGVEQECSYAVPKDTWSEQLRNKPVPETARPKKFLEVLRIVRERAYYHS